MSSPPPSLGFPFAFPPGFPASQSPPPAEAPPLPNTPFWLVDTFTDAPFTGGTAAVVLLRASGTRWPEGVWLAGVAAELASSTTVFVSRRLTPAGEADGSFALRAFTPHGTELSLTAHGLLAAAHALASAGAASQPCLIFHTRAGVMRAALQPSGSAVAIELPTAAVTEVTAPAVPGAVQAALGAAMPLPIWVGRSTDLNDWIIITSPDAVRDCVPDLRQLAALGGRGVALTAASADVPWARGAHYVARWFAPAVGVTEDAAPGSPHCALGPLWAARLGKRDLVALQLSARSAVFAVRCEEGDPPQRLALLGGCVTVARGELMVAQSEGATGDPMQGD